MKPAPKTGGVVTLVLILAILGIGAAILLNTPQTTHLQVTYAQMPPSDTGLTQWLKSQTGVTQATAIRGGQGLTVDVARHPGSPEPDVLSACARLGYGGRGGYSSVTRYAPLGIGR